MPPHPQPKKVMLAEPVARGQGLGLEAVALMMQYAAEALGTTTFTAKIGLDNHVSLHLFQHKLPFREVLLHAEFQVDQPQPSLLPTPPPQD